MHNLLINWLLIAAKNANINNCSLGVKHFKLSIKTEKPADFN